MEIICLVEVQGKRFIFNTPMEENPYVFYLLNVDDMKWFESIYVRMFIKEHENSDELINKINQSDNININDIAVNVFTTIELRDNVWTNWINEQPNLLLDFPVCHSPTFATNNIHYPSSPIFTSNPYPWFQNE